jgi:hypothetical protein
VRDDAANLDEPLGPGPEFWAWAVVALPIAVLITLWVTVAWMPTASVPALSLLGGVARLWTLEPLRAMPRPRRLCWTGVGTAVVLGVVVAVLGLLMVAVMLMYSATCDEAGGCFPAGDD